MSTVGKDNSVYVSVINNTDHPITLPVKSEVAKFDVITAAQAERLVPIDPQLVALARLKNSDNPEAEINQLIKTLDPPKGQSIRPKPEYSKLWFPTPETFSDTSLLSPLQRRNF